MASGNIENYTGRLILPGDTDFDLNNSPVDQMCTIQKYSTSATNRPGGTGTVITSANGNYAGQFAMQDGKESPYYRYRTNSGEWSSWLPFVMGSIVPVTKGGTGATDETNARKNLGVCTWFGNMNGTKTMNFSATATGFLVLASSTSARMGVYFFRGGPSQTNVRDVVVSNVLTYTASTTEGKITLNFTASVGIYILWLSGSSYVTIS